MVFDLLSWFCLIAGGLTGIIGAVGIHRFPDFYSRTHAVGVTDTLSATLILLGLAFQAGLSLASFKLGLVFILLFLSSPTASHALVKAAVHGGLKPLLESDISEKKS
ncbi:MAG: monovalent cation/H(+) antiporter subunit G [Gammaproteobacteria bacterium]|nr:monovalent cation/H(+) antiporter subunit G [Gammaproteobacteria bacterium]